MIKYAKMSLFDAPPGSILMHACNAQGVWGRGIAAEFKRRFPASYAEYVKYSELYLNSYPLYGAVGKTFLLSEENEQEVCCLITSYDYGDVDPEKVILMQTIMALQDFCYYWEVTRNKPIYCNKFNSGLFNVPWEQTEEILRYFAVKYKLDITVCEV